VQTLDVGSVLRRAVAMYRDHWRPLLGMALGVWLATALLVVVVVTTVGASLVAPGPEGGVGVGVALVGLLAFAIEFVGQSILGGMYVVAVEDLRDGRQDRPVGEYFTAVRPKLGPLVVTTALAGLGVMIGLILFVVPGVVFMVWWSVAAAVVMLEGRSGSSALGRAKQIVSGHGWRMFLLLLVVVVAIWAATAVITGVARTVLPTEGMAGSFVESFAGVLVAPFAAIVPVIAYYDLTGRGMPLPA
jgi:hypothetical protein